MATRDGRASTKLEKKFLQTNPPYRPAPPSSRGGYRLASPPRQLTTTGTTGTPAPPAHRHHLEKRCTHPMVQRQFAPVNLAPSKSGASTFFDCRCTTAAKTPSRHHGTPPAAALRPSPRHASRSSRKIKFSPPARNPSQYLCQNIAPNQPQHHAPFQLANTHTIFFSFFLHPLRVQRKKVY